MSIRCSGFGRYQAVETENHQQFVDGVQVAVGLAAIRPLKPAMANNNQKLLLVAVGLAAIRPLKQFGVFSKPVPPYRCSGFGRYQAVETPFKGI